MTSVILLLALLGALALAVSLCLKARKRGCGCGCSGDSSAARNEPVERKREDASDSPFLIKPIVQLGTLHESTTDGITILWNASGEPGVTWSMRIRSLDVEGAQNVIVPVVSTDLPDLPPVGAHKQYQAVVSGISHGERFTYEVLRNEQVVFTAAAAAPKPRGASFRFVAVGDFGEGSPGQAKVFYQISRLAPDLVVVPGDVAYKRGRFSENLQYVFPFTNNDKASPETGAPLMRSTLFVACPGNHDYGRPTLGDVPDLDKHPDLLAFFYLWSQPLNGPYVGGVRNLARIIGEQEKRDAFLQAAAGRYPRMANFSFDYADTHWLFLDANEHVDWSSEGLREWVRKDLCDTSMRWKFVVFHQPAFTSHTRHRVEQRMRLVADIFQDNGVDLCISGHAHWYERLFPLKFFVKRHVDGELIDPTGAVTGDLHIDHSYDGSSNTRPNGVVYIVSGAGGARLHTSFVPVSGFEPFTYKIVSDRFSFTVVDVDSNIMTVRQISEDGEELDRFTVTK